MATNIRIAGYEQCSEGEIISVYPLSEGSRVYERKVTFINNGGPEPRTNGAPCIGIAPFGGIDVIWEQTNSFPLNVTIRIDTEAFINDEIYVEKEWVKDFSVYQSSYVRKNYKIPVEFWVGGKKTMYIVEFTLEYTRELPKPTGVRIGDKSLKDWIINTLLRLLGA